MNGGEIVTMKPEMTRIFDGWMAIGTGNAPKDPSMTELDNEVYRSCVDNDNITVTTGDEGQKNTYQFEISIRPGVHVGIDTTLREVGLFNADNVLITRDTIRPVKTISTQRMVGIKQPVISVGRDHQFRKTE